MSIRVSIRMPDRSAHLGSPTITLCRGPAAPNSEHTPLQRSILKSQHNPAPHRVGVKNVYFQKRCFSFLQERLYHQWHDRTPEYRQVREVGWRLKHRLCAPNLDAARLQEHGLATTVLGTPSRAARCGRSAQGVIACVHPQFCCLCCCRDAKQRRL